MTVSEALWGSDPCGGWALRQLGILGKDRQALQTAESQVPSGVSAGALLAETHEVLSGSCDG